MSGVRQLRHNRPSRYSSPAIVGEQHADDKPPEINGATQTSHAPWVEPAPRLPVPSFEDTRGLERVGVLEHMQPLGQPPTQKLLQKLKITAHPPRMSLHPSAQPADDVETPAMESESMDIASPVNGEMLPDSPAYQESVVPASPPKGRPPKRDYDEMATNSLSASPARRYSQNMSGMSKESIQEHLRQSRRSGYFEHALREARVNGDYDVLNGLERYRKHAERQGSPLWATLDNIVNQCATTEELKLFKRHIKKGIKLGRKVMNGSVSPLSVPSEDAIKSTASPRQKALPQSSILPASPILDTKPEEITRTPLRIKFRRTDHTFAPSLSPNHTILSNVTPDDIMAPVDETGESAALTPRRSSRKRADSSSSSSSLSSAKSIPEDFAPEIDRDRPEKRRPVRSSGQRQATNKVAATGTRTRSSITNHDEDRVPFEKYPSVNKKNKLGPKKFKLGRREEEIDPAIIAQTRQDLENQSVNDYQRQNYQESNERGPIQYNPPSTVHSEPGASQEPPAPVIHLRALRPHQEDTLSSPVSAQVPPAALGTDGNGKKRLYDEIDQDDVDVITPLSVSPAPPPMLKHPAQAAVATSRSGTPRRDTRLPPPEKKARKSARVMISPGKPKNGGITAGIARAGPTKERETVLGSGDSDQEDNDESCAACSGEGRLLCCDGCPRSFHHGCLEPPLDPEDEIEGEWFCPRCAARQRNQPPPTKGLMSQLIREVGDTIPTAYSLPYEIRNYFSGVKTGEDGQYEEVVPRTQPNGVKMNRAGFFEIPSYKETRDSKGNFICCYHCGLTSNGRDIIPCDFCSAKWHLDCLTPPLAAPPRRGVGDKPTATWRCPLHTEADLANVGLEEEIHAGELGRLGRLRKPRNAIPTDVTMTRGFKNNGVIEVEIEKDEELILKEVSMRGHVYRLPEKGIQLDFIDRVKRSWYEDQTFPGMMGTSKRYHSTMYRPNDDTKLYTIPTDPVVETAKATAVLRQRSIKEQQAVLHLVALGTNNKDNLAAYTGDALAQLTNQLVSEAPLEVTQSYEDDEKGMLVHLQDLVSKRLALLTKSTKNPSPTEKSNDDSTRTESVRKTHNYGTRNKGKPRKKLTNGLEFVDVHDADEDYEGDANTDGDGSAMDMAN